MTKVICNCPCQNYHAKNEPGMDLIPGEIYYLDLYDHTTVGSKNYVAVYNSHKNYIGQVSMVNFSQIRHR